MTSDFWQARVVLAATLVGLLPCAALAEDPITRMVADISAARIEARLRALVAFGTRNSLSDPKQESRGVGAARRWIKAELDHCAEASGGRLQVALDPHYVENGPRIPQPTEIVNVVATLPGTQAESQSRVYVVSGHYDSMPTSPVDAKTDAPGADDDASGTAAVMELACVLSHYKFDATLVFMTVAGEEQGLIGSRAWAQNAKAAGMNVAGMFTNDIIGNTKSPEGKVDRSRVRLFAEGVPALKEMPEELLVTLRTGGENDLPTRQLARHVRRVAEVYVRGFAVEVIYRRDRYLRGGDHIPFLELGWPALRFTEPVENFRHQHQDPRVVEGVQYGDLPQFVDFDYVAKVARVNAAALATLALAPAAPRNVELETTQLENDTTLRWQANTEPDVVGYRIVWRDSNAPFWQYRHDVGNVTRATISGVSKDNYVFGLQAYDRDWHVSVATYPRPAAK